MKKILLILFCLFFIYSSALKAQVVVEGKVINAFRIASLKLKYSKKGLHLKDSELDITLKDGGFSITVPIQENAIAQLQIENQGAETRILSLYLQNKKKLKITFDAGNPWKTLVFQGDLRFENEHWKSMSKSYPAAYGEVGKLFIKDTVAVSCFSKITEAKNQETEAFMKLAKQNKMHNQYVKFAKQEIEMYYLHLFNNIASMHFFTNFREQSNTFIKQGWDKVANEKIKPIIESTDLQLLKNYHAMYIKNPRFNGFWAFFFDAMPTPEESTPKAFEEGLYYKRLENKLAELFKDEVLEIQLVDFILAIEMQKKYEKCLIDMIDRFKQKIPNSAYSQNLERAQQEVITYHEQKNKPLDADIKIVENYSKIDKFTDLLAIFKGKTIFVDLWGTWCGSCKQEFKYLPEMKEYFKDKDLAYLYIADEKNTPNKDEKWLNMIKLHKLTGSHIIANDALLKDIWQQVATITDAEIEAIEDKEEQKSLQYVKEGKIQTYPTYLIVNEKGEVIIKYAHKPSTKEKLYKQIEKVLQEN